MNIYKELEVPKESKWNKSILHWRIRYVQTSIHNFIKWFPVLIHDRDWDHVYILRMLQKKLYFQREYIVKHNRHYSVEEINTQITKCLNLIEDIIEEYTAFKYYEIVNLIYKPYFKDKEVMINGKIHYELETAFDKDLTESEKEMYNIILHYAFEKGAEEHKGLMKELFTTLEENIQNWWD